MEHDYIYGKKAEADFCAEVFVEMRNIIEQTKLLVSDFEHLNEEAVIYTQKLTEWRAKQPEIIKIACADAATELVTVCVRNKEEILNLINPLIEANTKLVQHLQKPWYKRLF